MSQQKPLFVPLKREYFEAFRRGEKTTEFRPLGPRWNERTCALGRSVVLSLGYGKAHRLAGIITGFSTDPYPQRRPGWTDCYGDRHTIAACIEIKIIPTPNTPES